MAENQNFNILYLHTHDSGRYISPYGFNLPTPALQHLAEEGVLFRQAYCSCPTCSPSRASMLTGQTPHESGMMGLAHRGYAINDYNKHLSRYMQKYGYRTVLCGIQHEAADPHDIGYEEYIGNLDVNHKNDEYNAGEACRFLLEHRDDERHFFISVGFLNTHRPYPEPEKDIRADYMQPPLPLYDNEINRREMACYASAIQTVDKCIEKIMNTLYTTGMINNTLVIFTTDHGIAFPGMKGTLYDTGIGVSLIIRTPHPTCMKGKAVDVLTSQLDFYPTVCDYSGIPIPEWAEGKSLRPILEGTEKKIRNEIFAELTYHAAYEPKRCIRTNRYKLVRFYDWHNGIVPANIDDSMSKDFILKNQIENRVRPREMLFDLWDDPMERQNRAENAAYHDVYCDLSARLNEWMYRTRDPLCNYRYRVPAPAEAIVNKLCCYSPEDENYEDAATMGGHA